MSRLMAFCVVLLFHPPGLAAELGLAGTWKLERLVNFVDGKPVHPFGENPNGYFVYSPEGRLMIQIQRETPPAQWSSLDPGAGGFGAGAPWYVGYFGRYSVEGATITHHVEGGTILRYIGTDQRRPFVLDGDRLFIGERGRWERELTRVLPASRSKDGLR